MDLFEEMQINSGYKLFESDIVIDMAEPTGRCQRERVPKQWNYLIIHVGSL